MFDVMCGSDAVRVGNACRPSVTRPVALVMHTRRVGIPTRRVRVGRFRHLASVVLVDCRRRSRIRPRSSGLVAAQIPYTSSCARAASRHSLCTVHVPQIKKELAAYKRFRQLKKACNASGSSATNHHDVGNTRHAAAERHASSGAIRDDRTDVRHDARPRREPERQCSPSRLSPSTAPTDSKRDAPL